MSITITRVTREQAEDLLPILREAEEGEERIRSSLQDQACVTYALSLDGQTIGAAVVRWSSSPAEESELLYLAISAPQRGQGYGKRLVAAIQAELPTHGGALLVGTANSSLENIAFYQRCGFRMFEVRHDFFSYIQPPLEEHGIVMRDMIVFRYEPEVPTSAASSATFPHQ